MAKQLKMDRKNIYRREESRRVRAERVITGYVQHQYPEIYKQANDFYEHLNTIYPDKKDLRKCNEYEMLKHEKARKMRKFYKRKTKTTKDTMVLRIPLMDEATVETTIRSDEITSAAETTIWSDEIPATAETTIRSDEIPATVETTIRSDEIPATVETTTDLAPISDQELNQIIEGLREDPDLTNIFDDIEFEFDDCPLW